MMTEEKNVDVENSSVVNDSKENSMAKGKTKLINRFHYITVKFFI